MALHKVVIEHLSHAHKINQLSHLIVLISFLLTFVITRTVTYLQNANLFSQNPTNPHIHHLVPGIILLLIAGYASISFWDNRKLHLIMSAVFGIGAALTLDEFALWLFLKDVYWEEQGRLSIDAVIIVLAILAITYLAGLVEISRRKSLPAAD